MRLRRRAALAALAPLVLALLAVRPARASYEEFQGFDPVRAEEDDENLFDAWLARPPDDWRDAWEHATGAFRTDEGCFTSGQWYMAHDLKARSGFGRHAWLDIVFHQTADPEAQYEWLQLEWRFPTRLGLWGVRFRPEFDKSRQDFAAMWGVGADTTALEVQAVFTVEDMFNELWEFRQSRVGNASQPYELHPLEPALRVIHRGAAGDAWRHRVEAYAQWLTPSRQRFDAFDPTQRLKHTLWGEKGWLIAELGRGPAALQARWDHEQALSFDQYALGGPDPRLYRRRWSAEAEARWELSPRWALSGNWVYRDRAEDWRPPLADAAFRGLDRMSAAFVHARLKPGLGVRLGAMLDRVSIAEAGTVPLFSYGTRNEARAVLTVEARFGRVQIAGTEGIHLDHEPYPVTLGHDKGFLHLQTTF